MRSAQAAAHNNPSTIRSPSKKSTSLPLKNARRELFAQFIAAGVKTAEAYQRAGFTGGERPRWEVRNAPEVVERVDWLLKERVDRHALAAFRPEKAEADLRLRVLKKLERIAFADVRNVASWDKRAKLSPDGDVIAIADELNIVPSGKLSHDAAASIKGVFMKAGELRIEQHDPQPALEKLCKALGIYQDAAPPPSVTNNNTVNIQGVDALDAARRVAFLFAAATAQAPAERAPLTIEGKVAEE